MDVNNARQLVVGVLVVAAATMGRVQAQPTPARACVDYAFPDIELPNGYPFDAARAVALFRFHRQQDALRIIDAGRKLLAGPWRWRVPPDRRKALVSELDGLRRCVASTTPAGLATMTVRVLGDASDTSNKKVPQRGARVYVEGVFVGRTGPKGTLTTRIPSGPVRLEADIPITQSSSTDVEVAPGESKSIEIELSDGKEVAERTTLVLTEASNDIVPVTASTLTLNFMRDGRVAPVTRIDSVDLVDADGNSYDELTQLFDVVRGSIVAANARRVFDALASRFDHTIVLNVHDDVRTRDARRHDRVSRGTVATLGDACRATIEPCASGVTH